MKTPTELVRSTFGVTPHPFCEEDYEFGDCTTHAGELIAYVGATDRTIGFDDQDVTVCGVGFVCTAPQHRRQGHMARAIERVHSGALVRGRRFVLLNTAFPHLYVKFGYRAVPNLPLEWLVCDLTAVPWPYEAQVDLRGTW